MSELCSIPLEQVCEADEMAPACISAISRTGDNLNPSPPVYQLHIYPLYTDFVDPHKLKPAAKAEDLNHDSSEKVPFPLRKKRQDRECSMTFQRFNNPDQFEKRIYPEPFSRSSNNVPKRGIITGMSKKSSNNLKKRIARSGRIDIWSDFTYSDDVMANLSISERAKKSNYHKEELTRYVKKKFGISLIWKREWQKRKSGKLKGEAIPHFHVIFGGLTEKQRSIWSSICIQILIRWVEITKTINPDAWVVAINKKSYRKIENPKHAICYISKYFGKDQPIDLPEGESIGRCWGYSKNCPEKEPWTITLNEQETAKLIRHMVRKKKLKSKKNRFLKYQLHRGFSTFLFEDEIDIGRFLNFIGVDMFPHVYPDRVPF